ncbi:HflK protein [Salinisphaera shabanensis T35B1]|uniref:Modulator for HflB protease specific for phage lambda cII repressor protein n=1 Tax=Salinisphaera shabanensis E1L3A TaxID=1033802 RepID=A0ACB4V5Q5_9GAMM|nr:protease modulator HflK [Salinisphaera shabanensis]ERJ18983.1 Modulator for HflB protease specific for phage lambda cII repressor protein [Salinisphaera shabanensis E1L3A]
MAWNEPGKGQDPWGGGNKNNGSGPPDLDQIWRKFRARMSGNKGGSGGPESGGSGGAGGPSPAILLFIIPIALVIWLATGLYVVQPGEKGVVLRFGDYTQTQGPGWHWRIPYPVDRVYKVDTQQVRRAKNRAVMLTKDENIVEVEVAVQYRISDAMNYLFQLREPDATVEQVLRSAVREIVGTSRMNQVIQEGVQVEELEDRALQNVDLKEGSGQPAEKDALQGVDDKLVDEIKAQQESYPEITDRSRAALPENVRKIVQSTLSSYDAGVDVVAINVQYSQPPEQVQGAFEEAIKAREEEERKKNIARAYARDIVARAQGEKARIMLDARGYREQKTARAKGEAQRFTDLLAQYEKAPDVTRERLYLETMGDVLSNANLILAEQGGNGPMMYLPLEKMLNDSRRNKQVENAANDGMNGSQGSDSGNSAGTADSGSNDNRPSSTSRSSDSLRSRDRNS